MQAFEFIRSKIGFDIEIGKGVRYASDRPGLGININEKALAKHPPLAKDTTAAIATCRASRCGIRTLLFN